MSHPVGDLVGYAAAQAATWMSTQAVLASERDTGVVADLRRVGAPPDLMLAGDLLHVALHRVAAELGKPSVLPKWPLPNGLPSAVADTLGAGLLGVGAFLRCWPMLAEGFARAAPDPARQSASAAPPPHQAAIVKLSERKS